MLDHSPVLTALQTTTHHGVLDRVISKSQPHLVPDSLLWPVLGPVADRALQVDPAPVWAACDLRGKAIIVDSHN
jgi:hypothetical protein